MRLGRGAALAFVSAGVVASCMTDNSIGGDTVVRTPEGTGGSGPAGGSGGGEQGGGAGTTAGATGEGVGRGGAQVAGAGGAGGSAGAGGTVAPGIDAGAARPDGGAAGSSTDSGVAGGDAGAGGPSLCPVTGTTLCDGFENAAPGAAGSDWTITVMGTDRFAVDTTKFYRGSKSMHFTGTTQAYIQETKTFAGTTKATNNAHWGRYFIWFDAGATAPAGHYVFGTMDGTSTVAAANQFHFVGGTRGTVQTQIRTTSDLYTGGGTTPAAADPKVPTAADSWQCWEWQIQPDDSFQFYINGAPVTEMALAAGKDARGTTYPLPTTRTLQLGWEYFGGGPAVSGWIDEVAIGPDRIGCGN
jgi:hypothetical protein